MIDLFEFSKKELHEFASSADKENRELREQLEKANERVKALEKELKESDEDLGVTQQQSSQYENALEEVQAVFVDSDACPLFEPFNANNLSNWLNKFAIENQASEFERYADMCEAFRTTPTVGTLREHAKQLRKEQSND